MKQGEIIKNMYLNKGIHMVELDKIYPVSEVKGNVKIVKSFIDDKGSKINNEGVIYLNKLIIEVIEDGDIDIICGAGFIASIDEVWTKRFKKTQGWTGGDGIYSFNLTTGCDQFDLTQDFTNLFVFGDTFVGRTDLVTKRRYEPLLMPNNSLGYLEPNKQEVHFQINKNEKDSVIGFFSVDKKYDVKGTIPQNIVTYDQKKQNEGWLSGYNPKEVWVKFDLAIPTFVTHINIYNYFSHEDTSLSSRGIKSFSILGSDNDKDWNLVGKFEIEQSKSQDDFTQINVENTYRYFKFLIDPSLGIGNHNDDINEGIYAISRVEFYNGNQIYRDIHADASSILLQEPSRSWIWLQDGVVIGNNLYFFPFTVISDLNQPEGLQFAVTGVSMIKVPIINNRLDYKNAYQKKTPFLVRKGDSEFTIGGAIMPNTIQSGATNPDGYIYTYGYKTTIGLRQMIASRVKEEDIEFFDKWQFFNGHEWQYDILESAPLLDHISCEFSVSKILSGHYKDKYLAVFTYDVNTPYVSFSIGDSLVGPFADPQTIYHTPEQELLKSTTYTYNAKAHPQISSSTSVLVSYNTNTYSFDHNMSNADVYRPRFIRLCDTTTKK